MMVGIRRAIPPPLFLVLLLSLLLLFIIVVRLLLDSYRPGGPCRCLLPFISSLFFCFVLFSFGINRCLTVLASAPTDFYYSFPSFSFRSSNQQDKRVTRSGFAFQISFPLHIPPPLRRTTHTPFTVGFHVMLHEFLVPCLPTK